MSHARRRVLKAAGAIALGTTVGRLPGAGAATQRRPTARIEPVTDEHFGVKVVDPYRWMENPKDRDWLPFLRGQNDYTRAALDSLPGREQLVRRIQALSGDVAVTQKVQPLPGLLFYEQRSAGSENFRLLVRDAAGTSRVLIDPTAMKAGGAHVSLDWWEVSPDGAHVAYGLSRAGSEASVLHVMEIATGRILPESIDKTDSAQPAWLADGSGFFYLQFTGEHGSPEYYLDGRARFHRLGTDPASDPIVLKRGLVANIPILPNQIPTIVVPPGSDCAMAVVSDIRPEYALWSAPLAAVVAGTPRWKPVAAFDDQVTGMAVLGDDLFLIVNGSAVRGRVVRTSASAPDLKRAAEVMPHGPRVIEHLAAARNGVFVTIMDGGIQRLARIARDGSVHAVPLPFEGTVDGVFASPLLDGAYADLSGWFVPQSIWRIEADRDAVADAGLAPRARIDASMYEARREFALAGDGVRIPYWTLSRRGLERGGRNPTLVTGYGAYQISSTPGFSPARFAFLDAGGVFVVANVRGGGEFGRQWHEAGQKRTKPNTWRDLIAVCEKLVADRVTRPEKLAIMGTSAGGITVGRALTERPDLFAAAISNVGWSNPLRYVAEQDSYVEVPEWGSIDDEQGFRGLLAMDSYQSVRDGVRYPAVLCITGVTDPRVAPFHVAKFAARLQAATASANPVLLRVDFDAGHGIGSTRSQSDQLNADIFSFVLWRTGDPRFTPKG